MATRDAACQLGRSPLPITMQRVPGVAADAAWTRASIDSPLMWEGRYFLSWYTAHNAVDDFAQLNIKDIDT